MGSSKRCVACVALLIFGVVRTDSFAAYFPSDVDQKVARALRFTVFAKSECGVALDQEPEPEDFIAAVYALGLAAAINPQAKVGNDNATLLHLAQQLTKLRPGHCRAVALEIALTGNDVAQVHHSHCFASGFDARRVANLFLAEALCDFVHVELLQKEIFQLGGVEAFGNITFESTRLFKLALQHSSESRCALLGLISVHSWRGEMSAALEFARTGMRLKYWDRPDQLCETEFDTRLLTSGPFPDLASYPAVQGAIRRLEEEVKILLPRLRKDAQAVRVNDDGALIVDPRGAGRWFNRIMRPLNEEERIGEFRRWGLRHNGSGSAWKQLASLFERMLKIEVHYVEFLTTEPGLALLPHAGLTNANWYAMCGIEVPNGHPAVLDAPLTRTAYPHLPGEATEQAFAVGKCFAFDDCFVHSLRHPRDSSGGNRTIVLLAFDHPDLPSDAEPRLRPLPAAERLFATGSENCERTGGRREAEEL